MFRSEAHFSNYGKWSEYFTGNKSEKGTVPESSNNDTCALAQVSLIEAINDPSYFIRRINSRIIELNKNRETPISNMTIYFDLNKTILTVDEVKGYGRREIILLEKYKNDSLFLRWAYGVLYEGTNYSPFYQDWIINFKKSSNEPELIELAARYSKFDISSITGVGEDNVVSSFWECLEWMNNGGDNGNVVFNIVFRTFGTDLSAMFEKIEAHGFAYLISKIDSIPIIHKTIHKIPSNYLEPSKIQELILKNHIIVDELGQLWLQSGNPVPGPKEKDTDEYNRVTTALERAAVSSLELKNYPEPYLYVNDCKDILTSIELDKCVGIDEFLSHMVVNNRNRGMIKSMIGIQDNYKPWSRKNWKAGKPIPVYGHSIVFDDYNYIKKEEEMGTYITSIYQEDKLVEGTKSELMKKYPML